MSADNGYLVRKNAEGKIVVQHYFLSPDEYPPIDDPKAKVYDTLEEAITDNAEAAYDTEYGFHIELEEVDRL